MGPFFGETAGPEAVDKDACAVGLGRGFVDTFELKRPGRFLPCVG
jgi:hypothetical protein